MADDWLRKQIEMAKIASMQDLFLKNHPEWRERLKKEPFPQEQMEREWKEQRKKEYQENGDEALDLLSMLADDDENG